MSTIRDVAKRAGVAISTVSAVLNRSAPVSEDAIARVEAAIAEIGYTPHGAAQSLRSGRSRLIGLVVPNIANPLCAEIARGVSEVADADDGISPYMVQTTGLLALVLGWLGAHRFYVGHRRTAALQATLGILSILSGGVPVFLLPLLLWVVLDLVWIGTRDFHDGQGRRIARWSAQDTRRYRGFVRAVRPRDAMASESSRAAALILAVLLGIFGAHRFYVGRIGSGLGMLFTLGGLGIWWLTDIVRVATGRLRDSEGKRVSEWE